MAKSPKQKKQKGLLTPEEEAIIERRKKELEEKLRYEFTHGKKLIEQKEKEFEEAVKENPVAYVVGAFIAGMIFGKLMK